MGQPGHGGRGHKDRDADLVADEGCGEVTSCAVDKDPRAEEDLLVDKVVVALGPQVVAGREVVGPCLSRDALGGLLLDLIQVHERTHRDWDIVPSLDDGVFRCGLGLGEGFLVDLTENVLGLEVLLEGARRVDRVVLVCGILAGKLEDDLLSTRVRWQELGHIVDLAIEDDPAALWGVVLGHWREGGVVSVELHPLET